MANTKTPDPVALERALNGSVPPRQNFIILGAKGARNGIVVTGGERSPGVCNIVNAGTPRKWDKQGGWGYDGASLTYLGEDLSEFDVQIAIWEKDHWKQWDQFASVIERSFNDRNDPSLTIRHPVLIKPPLRITTVVVRNVSQFEQSESGLWTCTVGFTVWKQRKQALNKVEGVPSAGTSSPYMDPEIRSLMRQAGLPVPDFTESEFVGRRGR